MSQDPLLPAEAIASQPLDSLSLGQIAGLVWRRRLLFALVALLPVLLALGYLHLATYKYRADLAVAPPQTGGSGSIGGQLGGNLGGLAALAGVGVGGQSGGLNFQLYREAIYERQTAQMLAGKPWVMRGIFASEWDAGAGRWHEPQGVLPGLKRALLAIIGRPDPGWRPPDAARLQDAIGDTVSVAVTTRSPVVRVSFLHPDPRFAARFVDELHSVVDDQLRARLLRRTSDNIAYLSEKLAQVTIAEHRLALAQALSEQEKLRMTASSTVAFSAEPFGPAATARKPASPNGPAILAVALVVGFGIALAFVLVAEFAMARRR